MKAEAIPTILERLSRGPTDDMELSELACWAVGDKERIELLRRQWPTRYLPVVDHYFCLSRLGEGVSGVVYKAVDMARGAPEFVAVKLLRFSCKEEEQRFRDREIEILRRLDAPHVARYRDSGAFGGTLYLVTDLIEGRPLDRYITNELTCLEDKLALFGRVCQVVSEIHERGVVHRDLKPNHILVDSEGQPWIVDLGISRAGGEDWSTRIRRDQTELGNIIGTARYMSPEQASGGAWPVDHRADIWSLGIMLYETVTDGDYPYDLDVGDDRERDRSLLRRIRTDMPKAPRVADVRYARSLETLISRCLAFEAEQRVSSAAELGRDIERCLTRKVIQTKRLPISYKLKRMAVALANEWRVGLWALTVSSVVIFLSAYCLFVGVRWRQQAADFGGSTRAILSADVPSGFGNDVVVVGISNQSIDLVPKAGIDGIVGSITGDIRTWRGVHAHLMRRLAGCKPKAIVWDYYFRSQQEADGEFAEAVRKLHRSGVSVVLAVRGLRNDGAPDLSASLFDPIADIGFCGVIYARDMVKREGEFVIAMRRGDRVYPALALSAFAAVVHPGCRMAVDWTYASRKLRLVYHPRNVVEDPPEIDPVQLTTSYEVDGVKLGTRPGDKFAIKTFELRQPSWWEERTVLYHDLFTMDESELEEVVGGKVVVIGDLRVAGMFGIDDRHDVRYGTEVIEDVPGCYLLADAISGLLTNRSMVSNTRATGILSKASFSVVVVAAILGCLFPFYMLRQEHCSSTRVRGLWLALLVVCAACCLIILPWVHLRWAVHLACSGAAFSLSSSSSCLIEFARSRYGYANTVSW